LLDLQYFCQSRLAMRPLEAAYRAKGPESDHHDQAFTASI